MRNERARKTAPRSKVEKYLFGHGKQPGRAHHTQRQRLTCLRMATIPTNTTPTSPRPAGYPSQPPAPSPTSCAPCQSTRLSDPRTFRGTFTVCDVAHNAREFAAEFVWMMAHGRVFRVPRGWAEKEHPGGFVAIRGHAGADATLDFDFHSAAAQRMWQQWEVGRVVPCPVSSCAVC